MSEVGRPLPRITNETRDFWAGCKRHELLVQHCRTCGHRQHYPRALCTACLSFEVEMRPASGRGEVHSFSVIRRAPSPAFAGKVPYVVALVDLVEGVRLFSTVSGCAPEQVRIGMPVEVFFEDVSDEVSLPCFRPVGGGVA